MKLADELVVQHGFDPVNVAPEAWQANKVIAFSVDKALSRAAQECRRIGKGTGSGAYEACEKAIEALMSGGGK